MAAVDVAHRASKTLPSPRLANYSRKAAPTSRARKAYIEAAEHDDDDVADHTDKDDEVEAADAFTLVPHVAEQTLHAVHSAIFGQPWADLELVVSAGGKDEVIYANSKVLKKACPALMRQISTTGRAELDTMEQEQINAAAAKNKNVVAAKRGARPPSSRRSTNSLGLVDYGRSSRLGRLDHHDEDGEDLDDVHAAKHHHDAEDEEYADSLAEQPKPSHLDDDDDDDDAHQDVDSFGEDDIDVGSRGKVAGAVAPAPAVETLTPPTFSRSSSRFSKLMKFMNKDKASPSAETDAALPFTSIGNASSTDYAAAGETGTYGGRSRVRRYSAGNDLSSAAAAAGARGSAASRVQVTGCSPATLQALVFYLYTGHATFASRLAAAPSRRYRRTRRDSSSDASLHSDRAESVDHSQEEEEDLDDDAAVLSNARVSKSSSFPPVFSATAAYCIGRQLGLRDLATKAFDHICLELSPKTVLADLLSPFVDRFDEVQRAHLDYVSDNWDRVKRRPDFEQTVGRLVMGEYREARKALLKLFAKLSVADSRAR